MGNRLVLSSALLTLCIAVSSLSYFMLGFDATGEPLFEQYVYELFIISPVLSLCAVVWFLNEGNTLDTCAWNIFFGHMLGFCAFCAWIAVSVGDFTALSALPFFFLPLFMLGIVHLFVLCFALALGAGLSHMFRKFTKERRIG